MSFSHFLKISLGAGSQSQKVEVMRQGEISVSINGSKHLSHIV